MKAEVLETIGETALRQPARINTALGANDRAKYLLSLLQAAMAQADYPDRPGTNLRSERLASGLDDPELDDFVGAARREGKAYRMPDAADIFARLAQEMRTVASPVIADGAAPELAGRLDAQLATLPKPADLGPDGETVSGETIAAITRAGGKGADSIHQLLMDLHKALNSLQAKLAEEQLDGAAVYGISAADRPRIAAFMAGVNRTAPLKFTHPGLGATATRAGEQLVIQDDIGTTDAHVIVIHVQGRTVTMTYSDVHPERGRFLRDMLSHFPVSWTNAESREVASLAGGKPFSLSTGRLEAPDEAELLRYLEWLGSRLVFLIDWNRARKQLRNFASNAQACAVLRWAAENEHGHRGFLELGGAVLINQAIESTAGSAMHFGDRLSDVLGEEATGAFLRFVLQAASQGLLARHSHVLVHDRVRTELAAHFSDEARRLLTTARDHAGLVFELATLVWDAVHSAESLKAAAPELVQRARGFEHDADQLVSDVREIVRRRADHAVLLELIAAADPAANCLEETIFLLGLLADTGPGGAPLEALCRLADLLLEAAQEWVKALANAVHVARPSLGSDGKQDDVDDFLSAIERIAALEHEADEAERVVTRTAVQQAADFRQLYLYSAMARDLEMASDAFRHASLLAREHVLGRLLGS